MATVIIKASTKPKRQRKNTATPRKLGATYVTTMDKTYPIPRIAISRYANRIVTLAV
jgi:hypothetical protein